MNDPGKKAIWAMALPFSKLCSILLMLSLILNVMGLGVPGFSWRPRARISSRLPTLADWTVHSLDESISSFRGVRCTFSLLFYLK